MPRTYKTLVTIIVTLLGVAGCANGGASATFTQLVTSNVSSVATSTIQETETKTVFVTLMQPPITVVKTITQPPVIVVQTTTPTGTGTSPPSTFTQTGTWTLSGSIYFLGSKNSGSSASNYARSLGFSGGNLSGSMSYVYNKLGVYWDDISSSNTFILFNASAEDPSILRDWPSAYSAVFPFTDLELANISSLPFALLKQQPGGPIRAIIISNKPEDFLTFVTAMKNALVPVGVPWTLENGQIVACKMGGGWYKAPNELSDVNFRVFYPDGRGDDAAKMLNWVDRVASILKKSFPDFLDVIGQRIIVQLNETGDPGQASADVERPSINFVTPSVAIAQSSYYDADYYLGNIAHEIGHIMQDRYRKRTGGYQATDCPQWFREGFGEYLRLLTTGAQSFDQKLGVRYASQKPLIIANG